MRGRPSFQMSLSHRMAARVVTAGRENEKFIGIHAGGEIVRVCKCRIILEQFLNSELTNIETRPG